MRRQFVRELRACAVDCDRLRRHFHRLGDRVATRRDRGILLVIALSVTACVSEVSAQPWREAYAAGDYKRAAALIRPVVLSVVAFAAEATDAAAFEALAEMYATGLGVQQDAALACAVMDHAARAARSIEAVRAVRSAPPGYEYVAALRYEAEIKRLDSRSAELCGRLSEGDRAESLRLLACPTAAFPRHFYDIGEGRSIEIDRNGVRLRHDGGEWSQPHLDCPLAFELVRYSRLDPPSLGAGPARQVLELFTWEAAWNEAGEHTLALRWRAFEIVGVALTMRAKETVSFLPASHHR